MPLTYTVQGGDFNSPKTVWLDPRSANTSLDDQVNDWILANIKQTGAERALPVPFLSPQALALDIYDIYRPGPVSQGSTESTTTTPTGPG